jgi:hypothetical protein
MKRLLGVFLFVALVGASAMSAGTLSKQERDALIKHLKKTEKLLKEATRGLSAEQWKYKPAADRWSVQDCLEHLTLTEEFLLDRVRNGVLKAPPSPVDPAKAKETDDFVLKVIPDRTNRVQAPEPLRPSGKWATPQEMLKEFSARRKKTIAYVQSTQDDLRAHKVDSPIGRPMDGYQWLLLTSAHTERHTAQAVEVKSSPNFPRKKGY